MQIRPEAVEVYNEGCAAMAAGAFINAAACFRAALILDPASADARYNLACALQQGGDAAAAASMFRRCLADNPDDLDSAFNFGWNLQKAGDLPGAISAYHDCLVRHPSYDKALFNLGSCLQQTDDTAGAIATFRECLAQHPDHHESAYNLACLLQNRGDLDAAIRLYRKCLAQNPQHRDSLFNLASCLQEAGDIPGAIEAYRSCMRFHADHPDAVDNLASLLIAQDEAGEAAGLLEEFCARHPEHRYLVINLAVARWRARMSQAASSDAGLGLRRILVACMPKSGSTFLADLLSRLPGMQRVHLVPDYGRREQELDLEQLVSHAGLSYVTQLHLRPSKVTLELISVFGLKPVFLYRNIWDVMASMRDHMFTHSLDWSMAQIDAAFRDWDEGRQYEFLARTVMPWFIDFYVSWWRQPDRLAVRYEDLIADPQGTIGRIAAWAGITASSEELGRALAETGHSATFNKGGSGRGKAVPAAARAHVEALAGFYPDVDFAPLFGGG